MGSSWLTAVKRALTSPTKGSPKTKKSCKRDDQTKEDEKKKSEKRRWIFKKCTSHIPPCKADVTRIDEKPADVITVDEQRRVIAAVEASAAAAKAAVATAQAAVKSFRESRTANLVREHYAALIIQTAFRGYLARQALSALKGIVKLQALVRGQNIRKQAKMTLKCMQALIRVQAKIHGRREMPSHDGTRKSMFAESNNLWDKYRDIRRRNSTSREANNITDMLEDQPFTFDDIDAVFQTRKDQALNCRRTLADALSEQVRRSDRSQLIKDEKEATEKGQWLNQYLESKQSWENDYRDSIKTVDIQSLQTHLRTPDNFQGFQNQDPPNRRHSLHVSSPLRSPYYNASYKSPMSPSLCNARPLQVRPASPRSARGLRSHSTTSTPTLRASCPSAVYRNRASSTAVTPNYMAATESAKARARTQSTPRQRASTSDRERGGSVRKRLSYNPVPEPDSEGSIYTDYGWYNQDLRSPSFRSVQAGLYPLEKRTLSSCYTEAMGGELSPASTTQLRRWLS